MRVIDNDGNPLGILPTQEAIQRALDAGFDLVEVAPTADPPVCKIMDYGKFKYEKAKKEKEAKKKQHVMHLKEIKFHPKTDVHDYKFKIDHARKFLIKGDRVKLTVVFRGREIAYKDFGIQLLDRVDQDLADIAVVETRYKMEGKNMISTYVPDKVKVQAVKRRMEKEKAQLEKELQEREKLEAQQAVEMKQ